MTRLLRWLMRLFPSEFRRRYGDELVELLATRARHARRRHGWPGVARMWITQGPDLLRSAVAEHRDRPHDPHIPRRGQAPMSSLLQDTRHALRNLKKQPTFTVVVVLTLALGIGATTAIFSMLDGVLLEPLPYAGSARLVDVSHRTVRGGGVPQLPATYFTYRDENRVFEDIGLWRPGTVTITGSGDAEQVEMVALTEAVLPLLRTRPALGRGFTAADVEPGAPATVILGHGYWHRRFGGDPGALGRQLRVEGAGYEVIGVMPEGFRFLDRSPAVYLPIRLDPGYEPTVLSFDYYGVARLEDGVTLEEASRDVARMIPMSVERYGWLTPAQMRELDFGPWLRPLKEVVVGDVGTVLWVLMATVSLVLLIACANVANLLLVRLESRRREVAVRAALGASRGRIALQFLTESLLLGGLGGLAGLGLAAGGLRAFQATGGADLPRLAEVGLDPTVLTFACAVSLLVGLVFGVLPVTRRSPDLAGTLEEGGRGGSDGRHRLRDLLAVAEVALALILLVGATLMVRSYRALGDVHPGFERPEEVLTFTISIPRQEVPGIELGLATYRRILEGLGDIPGAESAGAASGLALTDRSNKNSIVAEGRPVGGDAALSVGYKAVAGDYFPTMGIPLVAGRSITWRDVQDRRPVGVVNEKLARELWGDAASALGRRIRHRPEDPWREVVGVVGNVRDAGLREDPPRLVYWPVVVEDFLGFDVWLRNRMSFVVRTTGSDPAGLVPAVRRVVREVSPDLPLADVRTLEDVTAASIARTSLTLVLLLVAAGVAVSLGAVGIYGVVSRVFARRTREIGVRVALGARDADIRRMVLRQGGGLAAVGVGAGVAGALGLTRFLSSLLYGVGTADPLSFAGAAAGVLLVALLATWLPARRAARQDPLDALRAE